MNKVPKALKEFLIRHGPSARPGEVVATTANDSDDSLSGGEEAQPASDDVDPGHHAQPLDYSDAQSIIAGPNMTPSGKYVFSFSLPFSNPLAGLLRPDPAPKQIVDYDLSLATISTVEEQELFEALRNQRQPNTHIRAVKTALSSSIDTLPFMRQTSLPQLPEINGTVIIMGGYRGSVLRDRKTQRRVWIPIKVGLNIQNIDLTVDPDDAAEEQMEQAIYADGMLTHVGPIDICRKLIRLLAAQPNCRVVEFSYDWRLSCDFNTQKLMEFVRTLAEPPLVIAHSMGGLLTHNAMQRDPSMFRGVVYAGVPSACPNILGPLKHGDDVFLSSKILTMQVNFLMRSSFVFLPLNGQCFEDRKDPSLKYDLDFFDAETWTEYDLSPLVSRQRRDEKQEHTIPTKNEKAVLVAKAQDTNGAKRSRKLSVAFNLPPSEQLPYAVARDYLERTLKRTKAFLSELEFDPVKKYPPLAVIYGVTTPTAKGARVDGLEGIRQGDFSDLVFGPGDGVVYHKKIMPMSSGFDVVAKIPSDKSHVFLLKDLDAVSQALRAILREEEIRSSA